MSEIMNVLIGFIVSVYVLFSKELFSGQCKKIVYALMKPDHANMTLHITKKSNEIFGGFIIGKIIDSAIIGVLRYEDRVIIERMSKAGKKVADIANEIGVHRDTIYKEFTRCGATKETYSAEKAQREI